MSRWRRVRAEAVAEARSFLRKPAAVFFTFVFPLILIGIFALVVDADEGLFDEPQSYYLPGYLAVVVLLTPLSRLSTTVARGRDHRRFEKLATTPLSRYEWLAAHVAVNTALVAAACVVIVGLLVVLADVDVAPSLYLPAFVLLATAAFCGLGAVIGRLTRSEDGAIAASNGVGFPMLFLADTFLPPDRLPTALAAAVDLLPLTYFARGVRSAAAGSPAGAELAVVAGLAVAGFVVGALSLPWRE